MSESQTTEKSPEELLEQMNAAVVEEQAQFGIHEPPKDSPVYAAHDVYMNMVEANKRRERQNLEFEKRAVTDGLTLVNLQKNVYEQRLREIENMLGSL